jgi:hypothetical protein
LVTGKQEILIDGAEFHKTGWQFALVGTFVFDIEGDSCELKIKADDFGDLKYILSVNGSLVLPEAPLRTAQPESPKVSQGSSVFVVHMRDAGVNTTVEFIETTLDVLVNGRKMETEGDFGDDGGSIYNFTLTAVPGSASGGAPSPPGRASTGAGAAPTINSRTAQRADATLLVKPSTQLKGGVAGLLTVFGNVDIVRVSGPSS